MSEPVIALAFGLVFWFVLVPLLLVFVFTLLDVFSRQDIGLSKLVWAFDPWVSKTPEWPDEPYARATVKAQAGQPNRGFTTMDRQLHAGQKR